MKIYIDKAFRCHTSPGPDTQEVDSDFFNAKSPTFVEGYVFVPRGQTWTREDGQTFQGEMACPAVPVEPLLIAQAEYERTQAAMEKAYREGVNSV